MTHNDFFANGAVDSRLGSNCYAPCASAEAKRKAWSHGRIYSRCKTDCRRSRWSSHWNLV